MPPPSPDELHEFIEDPLVDKLEVLDKICSRVRFRSRILAVVVAVIGLPSTAFITRWYATNTASKIWIPAAVVAGAIAVYGVLWYRHVREEIPFEYKPDLVVPLVHYIDPRLKHRADRGIERDELAESGLIDDAITECTGGDLFEGTLGEMQVRFADVSVDTPGSTFRGLFFVAEFPEEIGDVDEGPGEEFEWSIAGDRLFAMRRAEGYFERDADSAIDDTGHLHRIGEELSALIGFAEDVL